MSVYSIFFFFLPENRKQFKCFEQHVFQTPDKTVKHGAADQKEQQHRVKKMSKRTMS